MFFVLTLVGQNEELRPGDTMEGMGDSLKKRFVFAGVSHHEYFSELQICFRCSGYTGTLEQNEASLIWNPWFGSEYIPSVSYMAHIFITSVSVSKHFQQNMGTETEDELYTKVKQGTLY